MVDISGISTLGKEPRINYKQKRQDFEAQMQEQATFMAKVVSSLSSDPMNPAKPQETMKLFQDLTNTQQIMHQTEILDRISRKMEMSQLLTASSLAGKSIEIQEDRFQVGGLNLQYQLPEDVDGAFVDILNAQGSVIRSLQVNPERGIHTISFDQKDDRGKRLEPGIYAYRTRYVGKGGLTEEKLLHSKPLHLQELRQQASYVLPRNAKVCMLTLETERGAVVHRWNGNLETGKHEVDLFETLRHKGKELPEGVYRFRANAVDHQDKPIETQSFMTVKVEGVEAGEQGPVFRYHGGLAVPFERYRAFVDSEKSNLRSQVESELQSAFLEN